MPERIERCETCKWWENGENKWTPRCRRFPPQLNTVRVAELVIELHRDGEHAACPIQCWEFPAVADDDWCGEWTRKTVDPLAFESERTISIWEWHKQGIPMMAIRDKARAELPGCKSITRERVRQIISRIERKLCKTALDTGLPE